MVRRDLCNGVCGVFKGFLGVFEVFLAFLGCFMVFWGCFYGVFMVFLPHIRILHIYVSISTVFAHFCLFSVRFSPHFQPFLLILASFFNHFISFLSHFTSFWPHFYPILPHFSPFSTVFHHFCLIFHSYAKHFWELLVLRIMLGVGQSLCNPPAFSILSDYFAPERRPVANSVCVRQWLVVGIWWKIWGRWKELLLGSILVVKSMELDGYW
jgi:hypothetical protein